ncbi:LacI family DNA-binding transcriptional regulator [Actinocrinis puniceicyclus]|uniref:LacI family DNA-binding transcriptional regulator n=1 Tax=Actinocrinis puniceicyclus TaxID=977794 RepID=A0A8J8BFP1_9ACTN|nr:LacI family DNA-binding transcriptional regulator [Actinocrinis puniceicyclus]MBS2966850.1 LacI family DNA-binding transcriptional regulator [Actinocrinis puniceicyclus]
MATQPARRPTLDEVALRAGVSRSAASRAINNARHVSRATREAVEHAIQELGYVPNPSARALATQQATAVILAVSHDDPALFADPFFAQVIVGVSAALETTDLVLMLALASSSRGRERVQRVLRSRRADGVMLMALRGDDPLYHLTEQLGLPVVVGGRPLHGEPEWYVDADNRGGARLATEHLIAIGRRRIATITGQLDTRAGADRLRGFQEAMAVAGLDHTRAEHGDFTEDSGAEATARLLAAHPDLDAVFAASDNMAAGVLRALKAHGRSVPADVAVVGFDDLPIARHTDPPLASVNQPIQAFGQEMAKMLISLINGERPTSLILPTRLTIRESAPMPGEPRDG